LFVIHDTFLLFATKILINVCFAIKGKITAGAHLPLGITQSTELVT